MSKLADRTIARPVSLKMKKVFSKALLLRNVHFHAHYLGFDLCDLIVFNKSEIHVSMWMGWPVSYDKWKAPLRSLFVWKPSINCFRPSLAFSQTFFWPPYEPKVIKRHIKAVYILSLFHTRWKVSKQSIHVIIKTFNAIKFEIYRFPYLFYTRQSISFGHLHCEMVVEICENFKNVRSWY